MSIIVLVMLLIGILPIGICLYGYCKRMVLCVQPKLEKDAYRKRSIYLTMLFILPVCVWKGTWLIVLFHWVVLIWGFQCIHHVISRLMRKPSLKWERMYQLGILPLLCTALVIGYGFYNAQQIQRMQYTITTTKTLDAPLRIALLSDLHYGTILHQTKLAEYVEVINQEHADIIVLDGDIVDEMTTYEELREVFFQLGKLQATYGTYFVYGNHDVSMYRSEPAFTMEELQQRIQANGITLLQDEAVSIRNDVVIIGRKDATLSRKQGRKHSLELLEGVNQEDFLLLLDHQPINLQENDSAGYDVQLSGHTHGGQIWPVGTIGQWFGFMEVAYGYQAMDHMQVIVSSGFSGWGFPLRTQKHNEYVMIDITSQVH